jgi:hypothetical protein
MQANENKVPTVLSYSRSTQQLSKWGFEAEGTTERQNPDRQFVDWFKVLLDEQKLNAIREHDTSGSVPESMDIVEHYFLDYLGSLYKHIEYKLTAELPQGKSWSTARIEFIFSVPTTWQPHPTVERFRSICARAGFADNRSHSIAIGLTEAEASAVHTSTEAPGLFKAEEVLLVCDIGGGTTDLSILKVVTLTESHLELKGMDMVQGRTIGSAKIDEAFERLALQRLEAANYSNPFRGTVSLQDVAWRMMKSREFQNAKCDFGASDFTPIFQVPTFEIENTYRSEQAHIFNGVMQFAKSDMQSLFDAQVVGLYELMDKQITSFKSAHPTKAISHLILSGGLGNSAYVQEKLKQKYSLGYGIQVHIAPEPQLAVCKGIVRDRLSMIERGTGILPWRCARASYGMICKVKYNPANPLHQGRKLAGDPYTGELYVTSAVEWFIRKVSDYNEVCERN